MHITGYKIWSGVLVIIMVATSRLALGQYDEKDFIRYTVQDGLSDNYIRSFQQDGRGYLWIGTDNGLNRFDGYVFKSYYQGSRELPLLGSQIYKLKLFDKDHLGILNRNGFQLLNTTNFSLKNYSIPDSTAFTLYLNNPWDAIQFENKEFAMSTLSGFYVFDADGKLSFRHDEYHLSDVGQQNMFYGKELFILSGHECLLYTDEYDLMLYNAEKKTFTTISKEDNEWAPLHPGIRGPRSAFIIRSQLNKDEFIALDYGENKVSYYNKGIDQEVISPLNLPQNDFNWESKINFLTENTFAVNCANFGFYIFTIDRQSGKITFNPKRFLGNYKVYCLFPDKDGRLWMGTSKGVLRQKLIQPFIHSSTYPPSPSDSLTGGFTCAYRLENKIYLGRFSSNHGLLIVDEASKKPEHQIQFFGGNNPWNQIRSIQQYHPDTLWIGTNEGLLWFDTKSFRYGTMFDDRKKNDISILNPVGKNGYAWMSGWMDAIVVRYHVPTRSFTFLSDQTTPAVPFVRIKNIVTDAFGDVWLSGHSLARWDQEKQNFDTLISVYGGRNKFEDDILGLVPDQIGSLWMFTPFNGLLEYRIREKQFFNYTTNDGLPSDIIISISPQINGNIWLAGKGNLSSFDIVSKKINIYDQQDGLPEDLPTSRYLYYDAAKGIVYLLQNHTLSYFSVPVPAYFDYGSNIIIEALAVNNENSFIYPENQLTLKPSDKNLTLHFGLVDFESGFNYQFFYKLNNNANWTSLGNQRNINLTGLSPGNYSIELKTIGKSGTQKTAAYNFTIPLPFWKTSWFITLIGLMIAGALFLFYRRRIKKVQQKADLDRLLSQTEMKALHAQMNPHFIFNSLNSIGEMILNNENDEATHYLGKFANLIRMTLDHSGQSFISLRNTMDYLTNYIEMEQIRNSYFTYRIKADEALDPDDTVLPPMLIQPFIENALWHGTTAKHKNIHINVDFIKNNGQLICCIDDNGRGIEQSLKSKTNNHDTHTPVGIYNIKNRIHLLNEKYRLKCSVTIEDKSNLEGYTETGTLVILKLPLEIYDDG